jgi:hypothetical protein
MIRNRILNDLKGWEVIVTMQIFLKSREKTTKKE